MYQNLTENLVQGFVTSEGKKIQDPPSHLAGRLVEFHRICVENFGPVTTELVVQDVNTLDQVERTELDLPSAPLGAVTEPKVTELGPASDLLNPSVILTNLSTASKANRKTGRTTSRIVMNQ